MVVAVAGDRSPDQIAKDNKISPYVVKKAMGVMRKTSQKELRTIVERAIRIDIDSKTKSAYNMDSAVDALIASIAT
jgi:DNA polymerase III delta subunit